MCTRSNIGLPQTDEWVAMLVGIAWAFIGQCNIIYPQTLRMGSAPRVYSIKETKLKNKISK